MPRLSRKQHDLPTVMPFVCDQVGENMDHIHGQIHPGHARRRDSTAPIDTEFKQFNDPATTSLQRRQ